MFLIEKILKGPRKSDGRWLVKWLGYTSKHNSWEPAENLPAVLIENKVVKKNARVQQKGATAVSGGNEMPIASHVHSTDLAEENLKTPVPRPSRKRAPPAHFHDNPSLEKSWDSSHGSGLCGPTSKRIKVSDNPTQHFAPSLGCAVPAQLELGQLTSQSGENQLNTSHIQLPQPHSLARDDERGHSPCPICISYSRPILKNLSPYIVQDTGKAADPAQTLVPEAADLSPPTKKRKTIPGGQWHWAISRFLPPFVVSLRHNILFAKFPLPDLYCPRPIMKNLSPCIVQDTGKVAAPAQTFVPEADLSPPTKKRKTIPGGQWHWAISFFAAICGITSSQHSFYEIERAVWSCSVLSFMCRSRSFQIPGRG